MSLPLQSDIRERDARPADGRPVRGEKPSRVPRIHRVGWKGVEREWERFLERLREDGFEVRLTSIAHPVQLEGTLPGGECFYFRERGGHVYLGVGGENPVSTPEWSVSETSWDSSMEAEAVRFLKPHEAYAALRRLMQRRKD
jgi:hypothetical protein